MAEGSKSDGKATSSKTKKAMGVSVTTDVSSLTLNTTTGNGTTVKKYTTCSDCDMFHDCSRGCLFWDKDAKQFKIKNFLAHKSATQINADGTKEPCKEWVAKLERYGFPKMGIVNQSDKDRVLADLKKCTSEMPLASVEERKRYADRKKRTVTQLATVSEGKSSRSSSTKKMEERMEELANQVLKVEGKLKKAKAKQKKSKSSGKKSRRSKEEDGSDSSSAPELLSDSDCSDSEGSYDN